MYSRITGTGRYLPKRVLTNDDLEGMLETSAEWIRTRTGIEQRHIAADHEATSDLAYHACLAAMKAAELEPQDIDMIVVGTCTPALVFPNVACILQERLGICDGPAFSVEAACSGFLYAFTIADQFIRAGSVRRALVVGAETLSRIQDWKDRETCILFGDGAGAVILEADDQPGVMYSSLGADGKYKDLLYVEPELSRKSTVLDELHVRMNGNEVFKVAVRTLERMVDQVVEDNDIKRGDIDWLIPHQANLRIIKATAKRLKMPMEQVVQTIADHGNTSAASVPIALDTAVRDNRIQRGDLLLLEAFGGGFTWGASLVRY